MAALTGAELRRAMAELGHTFTLEDLKDGREHRFMTVIVGDRENTLCSSGVILGIEPDGYVLVRFDGELNTQRKSAAELGIDAPDGQQQVCLKPTWRVHYTLLEGRVDTMQMHHCPCGTPRPDGKNCRDYPECVIQ